MIDINRFYVASKAWRFRIKWLAADPSLKDDKSKYARRWLDLLLSRFSGAWRSNLNDLDAFSPEEKHPKLHGILHNAATIDGLILSVGEGLFLANAYIGMKGSFRMLTR